MEQITPSQKAQLTSWAEQRDALLGDILRLDTEKSEKTKTNRELTASNTEIQNQVLIAEGRILEIEKKEKERISLISSEIIELEITKATLLAEISGLKQVIITLKEREGDLNTSVNLLNDTHEKVFDRTDDLETIVSNVEKISRENIIVINECLKTVVETTKEVVDINKKNVKESMVIIEKLPRAILEYRRPIPASRTILSKRVVSKEE